MKNILFYLLILGHMTSAHAMFQRLAVKPSLALCQSETTDSKADSSSINPITIEPFDVAKHGLAARQIFKESFPSTNIPDELYDCKSSHGFVLMDQEVVKGFMIVSDESLNFFQKLTFQLFGKDNARAIEWFAVGASSRNNNLGTLLWNHNEKDALEKAKDILVLIPTQKAISFYKKRGAYCLNEQCDFMKKCLISSPSHDTSATFIRNDAAENDILNFFSA